MNCSFIYAIPLMILWLFLSGGPHPKATLGLSRSHFKQISGRQSLLAPPSTNNFCNFNG